MDQPEQPPDKKFFHILKQYAAGEISAMNAADNIQQLGLPGYEDPSASEVVLWSKAAGFGIPCPSEAEAQAEANAVLARLKKH